MFVPVACSNCKKPFQVPETSLAKSTACPWCQATVLALPISGESQDIKPSVAEQAQVSANEEVAAASSRRSYRRLEAAATGEVVEPLSLDDESPPQTPTHSQPVPVRNRRARMLWILAAVFVMGATATITLAILQRKQGHLVSMEWQAFTPPDGSCSIDLLGQAREADSDPEHGERRYISQGWYSGNSAWIGWRDLTIAQVQEGTAKEGWVQLRKVFFDKERDRLKNKYGGYLAKDATIEQDPMTIEVRLDSPQGAVIERMIVTTKEPRPRVYFIGMAGKRLNLDGPEVKRLFGSFRVYD